MRNDDDIESLGISKAAGVGCFSLLFGLALLGIAGIYYWYFSVIEETGNQKFAQAPCCIAVPYMFFGKWVTIILIGLPGVWLVYVAVRNFSRNDGSEGQ